MKSVFETCAAKGELVIMAGAGVSAGNPSALPGWYAMNEIIVEVLSRRLETATQRPGWLARVIPEITRLREQEIFPPDYQAQIIEEMCGERYFKGLQALDIDVVNSAHDGIAALAAHGAVRAVVTTNFDRLIEHAFDRRGVAYGVAYDEAGYRAAAGALESGEKGNHHHQNPWMRGGPSVHDRYPQTASAGPVKVSAPLSGDSDEKLVDLHGLLCRGP